MLKIIDRLHNYFHYSMLLFYASLTGWLKYFFFKNLVSVKVMSASIEDYGIKKKNNCIFLIE